MRRTAMLFVVCSVSLIVLSAGCNKNEPPAPPQLGGPTTGNAGDIATVVRSIGFKLFGMTLFCFEHERYLPFYRGTKNCT